RAARLGRSRAGSESGHRLAEQGAFGVVACIAVLALWLWWRKAVSGRVAAAAIVVSVLSPYWISAGAGIVVLAVSAVRARHRRLAAGEPGRVARAVAPG